HPATAILPNGWKQRLIPLNNENTQGVTGWCLHPLDIAISKLVAGRPKDLEYVSALISFAELDESALDELARTLDEPESSQVLGRLNRLRG
ncbi:MAG: DUF6036 family nucleotidyltransferase, partial [Vulcanimicrobiota bacterium]